MSRALRATSRHPKKLLQALRGEAQAIPPLWMMRQAGRYLAEYREVRKKAKDFLSFCYSPELAAEVTLQPIRRFGFDAAIIFSDILVIPHGLGVPIRFAEGEGPLCEQDLSQLFEETWQPENITAFLAPVYEALGLVKSDLPEETTLIGFCGSPWTLAAYILEGKGSKDFLKARVFGLQNPKRMEKILYGLADAVAVHAMAQIEAGAEVIQLFDSWAGVLSETLFEQWVIEPTCHIVKKIKDVYPDIPLIGFPRGASLYYPHFAKTTGVEGVSVDTQISPRFMKEHLQPLVTVQGNLDPALLVAGGNALEKAVKTLKETLGTGPFIFNLGHGITPETPVAHVEQFVKWVREI